MAIGLAVSGLTSWPLPTVAGEPEGGLAGTGRSVNEPDAATINTPPFIGNPELRARLDPPGKITVAGERVHDQLLRRFYAAHDYQTVWTNHPTEASRLWNAILLAGKHGLDSTLFHSTTLTERGTALSPVERDLL